jgi:aminocarboxymuconate-semialdehyde decarboxylase
MITRRSVLQLTAAGLAAPAGALAAKPALKRSGRVAGRAVRTVDIHAHCDLDVRDLVAGTPLQGRGAPFAAGRYGLDDVRLAVMDRQGIDVQVVSINPFWYGADHALAARLIASLNDGLAAEIRKHPGRFAALATVALQHPELAADQLHDAMKGLGLRGVAIGCSVEGEELSSTRFDPFWQAAQDLDALVFLHPQDAAAATGIGKRVGGSGFLANVVGNPLETTLALSHLIFDGVLDRFPGLKLCGAHGGGYLPSYAGRSDLGCSVTPSACAKGPALKRKPSEYLRQIYVDSMVFTPEGLRHLAAECGPGRIMLGTDYPYPWVGRPLDLIARTPGLSNAERVAILGGTACGLLGLQT